VFYYFTFRTLKIIFKHFFFISKKKITPKGEMHLETMRFFENATGFFQKQQILFHENF
jgi:hypothetical protein